MNRKSGESGSQRATDEYEIRSEPQGGAVPADPPRIQAPPFGMSSRKSKQVLFDLQVTDGGGGDKKKKSGNQ